MVRIYRFAYITLLFMTFVFLTGSIAGVGYKIPLAILCAISLMLIMGNNKSLIINFKNLLLLISFISVSLWGMLIGVIKGFGINLAISEFIGIISPLIILALYNQKLISIRTIKKTMLIGAFVYSLMKIISEILIMSGAVDFLLFSNFIQDVFDYKIVSMLISPDYNIVRIYLVNDLLITLIPLILFSKDKVFHSKFVISVFYLAFFLSMFLSYSRFLIIIFLIASSLPLWIKNKTSVKKVVFSFYSFGLMALYLLIFGIPKTLKERFSVTNQNNIQSDTIRSEQFNAIIDMINNHSFLGAGLGSYNPVYLRSESQYVYELQWLSLVFKFGIPVFLVVSLIILTYFFINFKVNFKSILFFALTMSCGIFNPYLESTIMGACLLILYSVYGKNKKNQESMSSIQG